MTDLSEQLSAARYVLENREVQEDLWQTPSTIQTANLNTDLKTVLQSVIDFIQRPGQPTVTLEALSNTYPELTATLDLLSTANPSYESYINLISTPPEIDDAVLDESPAPSYNDQAPWKHCVTPTGFRLSKKGLVQVDDDDGVQITAQPVWVEAASRDPNNENWGMLVCWYDQLGQLHRRAFSKAYLHGQPTELAKVLAAGGLQITVGRERALCQYLSLCTSGQFMTAALATGWLGDAFVFPDMTVNEPEGEKIVFQPEGLSDIAKAIKRAGDFEKWREATKDLSELVIFLICGALSAPLRYLVNIEAGGFHIHDLSGRGKTTALQIAASVWGNGADPQIAGGNACYVQRYNATANALEAKAEHFNDLVLVMDEIGEGDSKQFGMTVYRLMAGVGRNRSGKDGNLRASKAWRITFLSAGEIGIQQFIESSGQRAKTGQLVRIVDIDCASCPPLFNTGAESDFYKQIAATHYGHAGRRFIASLVAIPNIKQDFDSLPSDLVGIATTKEAARVLKRFQLACYAGLIAVRNNILAVSEDQIINAARIAFNAWQKSTSTITEPERGVALVQDFILEHESRFQKTGDQYAPHNRAGWFRDDIYCFVPKVFSDVCAGLDATKVKKALYKMGLLVKNRPDSYNSTFKFDGEAYGGVVIKSEILTTTPENTFNGCNPCNPSITAGPDTVTTTDNAPVTTCNLADGVTSGYKSKNEPVTAKPPENKGGLQGLQELQVKSDSKPQTELDTAPVYVDDDQPGFDF